MQSTSGVSELRRRDSDSDSERESKKVRYGIGRRQNNPQKFREEWKNNPNFKLWLQAVKGMSLLYSLYLLYQLVPSKCSFIRFFNPFERVN